MSQMFKHWERALGALASYNNQFTDWVDIEIRQFFPFEKALFCYGEHCLGEIKVRHLLNFDHDESYLNQLQTNFESADRTALQNWLVVREPLLIDVNDMASSSQFSAVEFNEIQQFNLGRLAAHGQVDLDFRSGTYFSFAGIPEQLSDWHVRALKLMTPTLHTEFTKHLAHSVNDGVKSQAVSQALTNRQLEISRLVTKGFSNKEIARMLNISEKTIRNTLTAVYSKTNSRGRTELQAQIN